MEASVIIRTLLKMSQQLTIRTVRKDTERRIYCPQPSPALTSYPYTKSLTTLAEDTVPHLSCTTFSQLIAFKIKAKPKRFLSFSSCPCEFT